MHLRIYKFLPLLLALFLLPGCDDFLDVNENPNVATQPPLNGLMAAASYETGLNHFRVSNFTSYFVQYLASPNANGASDTYDEANYSSAWGNLYDTMTDLYDLIRFGEEQDAFHHTGVAKVMMAMNLGLAADAWGAVPYSDAFTGEVIQPEYDSQDEVYATILRLLDEALADLQSADNAVTLGASSDFIHGGKVDAWIKTAYGLRARYLNHLSKLPTYDPQAVLAAVDKSYTSNADDAQITAFVNRNPWAQVARNNANLVLDGWLSEQFIQHVNGDTYGVFDPRLPLITDPLPNGTYVGTPNGSGRRGDGTVQVETYLTTKDFYSSDDSPLLLLTYAEIKFIEAEAAFRAGNKERAVMAFRAGILANMAKVGVSIADAEAYIAAAYPNLSAATLTLADIFREKYTALFLQPETWVDARRFDYQYKDFSLPANAQLTEFIRRVQYPETELDRNRENTPTISSLAERLFWDQR